MTDYIAFLTGLLSGAHLVLFLQVMIPADMPPGLNELWNQWEARFGRSDRADSAFLGLVLVLLFAPIICLPFLGWKAVEFLSSL